MAPPPRLVQLLAALVLFLSPVLLLAVSGVHGTRHLHADGGGGDHRLGIGEAMHDGAVARWWSSTVVRKGGGGGHGGGGHSHGGHGSGRGRGRGRGNGHGKPGAPAVFYPRTVTGGHHRRSAAAVTAGRPSGRALLIVVAAIAVLLLRP